VITRKLDKLVNLYPGHIETEDKLFFPASLKYLNQPLMNKMLAEFWGFDRKIIHDKYSSLVSEAQSQRGL